METKGSDLIFKLDWVRNFKRLACFFIFNAT